MSLGVLELCELLSDAIDIDGERGISVLLGSSDLTSVRTRRFRLSVSVVPSVSASMSIPSTVDVPRPIGFGIGVSARDSGEC